MSDLVDALNSCGDDPALDHGTRSICGDAATELATLRSTIAEQQRTIDRMRAKLERLAIHRIDDGLLECAACSATWIRDEAAEHTPDCVLSLTPPPAQPQEDEGMS